MIPRRVYHKYYVRIYMERSLPCHKRLYKHIAEYKVKHKGYGHNNARFSIFFGYKEYERQYDPQNAGVPKSRYFRHNKVQYIPFYDVLQKIKYGDLYLVQRPISQYCQSLKIPNKQKTAIWRNISGSMRPFLVWPFPHVTRFKDSDQATSWHIEITA